MDKLAPPATMRSWLFSDRLRLPMSLMGTICGAGATYLIWPTDRGFGLAMALLTVAFGLDFVVTLPHPSPTS